MRVQRRNNHEVDGGGAAVRSRPTGETACSLRWRPIPQSWPIPQSFPQPASCARVRAAAPGGSARPSTPFSVDTANEEVRDGLQREDDRLASPRVRPRRAVGASPPGPSTSRPQRELRAGGHAASPAAEEDGRTPRLTEEHGAAGGHPQDRAAATMWSRWARRPTSGRGTDRFVALQHSGCRHSAHPASGTSSRSRRTLTGRRCRMHCEARPSMRSDEELRDDERH